LLHQSTALHYGNYAHAMRNVSRCGTWYLPHSRVHKSIAELCRNFGDSTITKGLIAYCVCAKRLYFYYRSKIWRYHRVPRTRFPVKFRNFGYSAINKGQIAYFFIEHARNGHISTCCQKSDVTIVFADPDFLYDAGILAIGEHLRQLLRFFISAWIFRTSGSKMAIFRGKIGEGVGRYRLPTNSFLLLGVYTSMSNLVKIDEEMWPLEWRHTDRQTDRHTDRQTQTDFIICTMLYAIAWGK